MPGFWEFAGAVLIAGTFGAGLLMRSPRPENQKPGKFPEHLVYVRSSDDVVSTGVMFSPPQTQSKRLVLIWVHGWGANFYLPTYVGIGRALATLGYPMISVNTRMHDLGNVEKYTSTGKRVRGGGYWGVTSDDARDIAAWIGYAEQLGYSRVVLVGHSAGWASVGRYQADSGDKRVAGLVSSPLVDVTASPSEAGSRLHSRKVGRIESSGGSDRTRLSISRNPRTCSGVRS